MSVEKNRVIASRIIQGFINGNNPAVADELFAQDFVNHSPQYGVTPDRDGLKQMIALLHQGFPDLQLIIEDLIAENDKVVLHMRATGTHTGELLGVPPTNKHFDSRQVSILRFEHGRVMERWNVTDQLEIMRQLGLM